MRFKLSLRSILIITSICSVAIFLASLSIDTPPKQVLRTLVNEDAELYQNTERQGPSMPSLLDRKRIAELTHLDTICKIRFPHLKSRKAIIAACKVKSANEITIFESDSRISFYGCELSHLNRLSVNKVSSSQIHDLLDAARNLEVLDIESDLSVDTAKAIGNSSSLTHLFCSGIKLDAEHVQGFALSSSLESLSFRDCEISQDAISQLKNVKALSRMGLDGSTYRADFLPHLLKLKSLTNLSLSKSSISDQELDTLVGMKQLDSLTLYGCRRLTTKCVPSLLKIKKLRVLDVLRTSFEDDLRLQSGEFF